MAYSLTWLAAVLRSAGLTVVEQPGWKTRGRGEMGKILGVLCHHTAGPLKGNAPSLKVVTNGRPGLSGPLSQLVLGRDGTFYVVAAGRANHAGAGNWRGVRNGNMNLIGIEAENTGLANDNPWPAAQMDAYARGVAAILMHVGASADMCVGHLEYATPVGRKSDPSFSVGNRGERLKAMAAFRARVAAIMRETRVRPVGLLEAPADDGPGDVGGDDETEAVTAKVEVTAAEETAAALTAVEIEGVQRRLKALKYHELGMVDGKWGGRLAAAIAAFKNDRHLSGEPVIDDALKAELDAAEREGWTRPIAAERAEGKPEGSRVLDAAEKQGTVGATIAGGGLLTWITTKLGEWFEPVQGMVDTFRPFFRPIGTFVADHWEIVLLAGGGFIVWQAARAWRARVDDHREGKTT